MLKRMILAAGVAVSLFLLWFAVNNYRSALPLAEANLRGLALSLSAAVENIAVHDPSLRALARFHTADIAYFALVDRNGVYRYHSNADLVGTSALDQVSPEAVRKGAMSDARVTLGTGERAYEFNTPVHLPGEDLLLRLTLHTYRADAVVRRARLDLLVVLALLAAGWVLAAILYRFAGREERHRAEMARRENLARLGEMGAMLAHEIRNPLAGIKGFAQIIEKKPQDERNSGFARRIVVEVRRLENLVGDLLAYSRTEGTLAASVDLRELIAHTVSLVRSEADELQVAIAVDCPDGLQVRGNRDRLGQVLLNLCTNALQAMPDGGLLRIAARASGRGVEISVADSGLGIAPDDMPRIFEPFFTTKARGTGLGLALCRKIVEEHGGKIHVASEPGKGTTVVVTLPGTEGGSHP